MSGVADRLARESLDYYLTHLQHKTGLPISTYFSAVKLRWLMDNVEEVRQAVLSHTAMFGTVDSWLIWVSYVDSDAGETESIWGRNPV